MNDAGAALLGEHDFAAFCRKREGATTIRSLLDLALGPRRRRARRGHRPGRRVLPQHGAVAGGLPGRGRGGPARARVGRARSSRRGVRDPAVTVAQAHGLTLEEVGYPADDGAGARARESRAVRTLSPPARLTRTSRLASTS